MDKLIPLPKELRMKTINKVEIIKPGLTFYSYGLYINSREKSLHGSPPALQEVTVIGERLAGGDFCVPDKNCFVGGRPAYGGSIKMLGTYNYANWNIGSHTSNWYVSLNGQDAEEVYRYLVFYWKLFYR